MGQSLWISKARQTLDVEIEKFSLQYIINSQNQLHNLSTSCLQTGVWSKQDKIAIKTHLNWWPYRSDQSQTNCVSKLSVQFRCWWRTYLLKFYLDGCNAISSRSTIWAQKSVISGYSVNRERSPLLTFADHHIGARDIQIPWEEH